jgi:hypothetical protein
LVENRGLTDPAEIEQALHFGEYMKNGTHVHTQSCVSSQKLHSHRLGWHGDYRNVGIVHSPQISLSEATLRFDRWRPVKKSFLIESSAPVLKSTSSPPVAGVGEKLSRASKDRMPQSQYTPHSINIFGPSWHVQGLCVDRGKKKEGPQGRVFTPGRSENRTRVAER